MFSPKIFGDRNFGDAIVVQDLKGIRVWKFFLCSPNQNSGAAPVYSIRVYIYCIFMLSLVPPQIFIRGGPHALDTEQHRESIWQEREACACRAASRPCRCPSRRRNASRWRFRRGFFGSVVKTMHRRRRCQYAPTRPTHDELVLVVRHSSVDLQVDRAISFYISMPFSASESSLSLLSFGYN